MRETTRSRCTLPQSAAICPIIQLLVDHGAETAAGEVDDHRLDIIGWATCFGDANKDIVDYLLAHGARHNIFSAVATGATAVIRDLASRSTADLDKVMDHANQGRRPLHLAVVKRQRAAAETLLDLGADVNATDTAGLTALDQAALDANVEMAQFLIEQARGSSCRRPSASTVHEDVERLLRDEPDCLKPAHRWGRLIVRAAEHASGDAIEALIRHGASVNVQDDMETSIDHTSGYTPLHAAAWNGNTAAAAVLLEHGADPTIRDGKYLRHAGRLGRLQQQARVPRPDSRGATSTSSMRSRSIERTAFRRFSTATRRRWCVRFGSMPVASLATSRGRSGT